MIHRPAPRHRRLLPVLLAGLLLLAFPVGASAFFSGGGSASGSGTVGTVSGASVRQSGTDVTVSWTASGGSGSGAVPGYMVLRSDGAVVCGEPAPVTTTSCVDHDVPAQTFSYSVFSASSVSPSIAILTAPSLGDTPSTPSAQPAPTFSFDGGGGTGYECQLDGDAYTTCASPQAYSGLADGAHAFRVRATRGDSNGPATSYAWTQDTSAPTITGKPTDPSASITASLSFTHSRGAYTFTCQRDGGGFSACSSPKNYGALGDGPHTFDVRAVDADGAATAAASYAWTVDATAPTTTIALSPASANGTNGWYSSAPAFTLTSTDGGGSGVAASYYQVDGGIAQAYAFAATIPEGQHTVTYWSTDAAGNTETHHTTATTKVDTTAPTPSLSATGANALLSGAGTLYYKGNAAGSTTIVDAITDVSSGAASARFPALATTGWSHAAETVTTGTNSGTTTTYTSSAFSWTAGPGTPAGFAVTSTDAAGKATTTPLTFVSDTGVPTGGALTVNGVAATTAGTSSSGGTSFTIGSRTDYTEVQSAARSGLASSVLRVQSAAAPGGVCGAAGSGGPFPTPTVVTGTTQPAGITGAFCFTYTLTGTDNVGNAAAISTTVKTVAPANTAAPAISGTATQGSTLTASTGTWTASPDSYSYQWQRCVPGGCSDIGGATGATYTVASADSDDALVVAVTAANGAGSATATSARASAVRASTPSTTLLTNGQINAIARLADGSTIVGGSFTTAGGHAAGAAAISAADATDDDAVSISGGTIIAAAPDGAGGYFLGGTFTAVNGVARRDLAQIDASGALTSWNPGANGSVNALAVSGSTVYVGGLFSTLGGGGSGTSARSNLGAVDASTGVATSWNPGANSYVYVLTVSGSTVYAGGAFTTLGGGGSGTSARSRIGAVDASTGAATAWDPGASGLVLALATSGSTVYVGGNFATLGGGGTGTNNRANIGAVDAATGAATSWNPGANSIVRAVAVSGSTVYVGGFFAFLGGGGGGTAFRPYIGAVDASTGAATAWNPGANNDVLALAVSPSGSTVYAGGDFTNLGGSARLNIGALDASSGSTTAWSPDANSTVNALAASGSTVFAGGAFSALGASSRPYLAKLSPSGQLLPLSTWNPSANGTVSALAVSGSTVYAGGAFTSIGGGGRNRLGAFDGATGAGTSWNPGANATVSTLALSGSTVYAGGVFTTLGGGGSGTSTRNRIGAVDTATGAATAWDPGANSNVNALQVSGATVYAGGTFTTLGGGGTGTSTRNRIGAVDTSSGAATAWDPGANNNVNALVLAGSTLYAGGVFTTLGGGGSGTSTRNRIGAVDTATGAATTWNPGANTTVNALALSGATVYAGGFFTTLGGGGSGVSSRNHIGAVDTVTGASTSWNPGGGSGAAVTALLAEPTRPVVAGTSNSALVWP